jgi:hypothetical protein
VKKWPAGTAWDCSPGLITRKECERACSANSDCAAFDQPSNVGSGVGECCLHMEGTRGDGGSSGTCSFKPTGNIVIMVFKDRFPLFLNHIENSFLSYTSFVVIFRRLLCTRSGLLWQ